MKRLFLLILMMAAYFCASQAQPISQDDARKKAANFFFDKKKGVKAMPGNEPNSNLEDSLKLVERDDAFYIFNLDSKGGYVIVSGDDRMPDVLGYSTNGHFDVDKMPDNLKAWLEGYKEQYQYLQEHEEARTIKETVTTSENRTKIYPLLTTFWGQGAPYNGQCPEIDGERSVTGCVATAMAQIMNYHQWPKKTSKAIEGYTTYTNNINVPSIGITSIDWDNMLDSYGDVAIKKSGDAVAKLMKLCGASVQMDYRVDGSSAFDIDAKNAFVEYFDYEDSNIKYLARNNYSGNDEWTQLIYNEVNNMRPVLYSGFSDDGGHSFVIDGYDKNDYFHVNWGWNGGDNGYFLLGALLDYNYSQGAIVGIKGKGVLPQHLYAYAELDNQTATFFYDDKREAKRGELFLNLSPESCFNSIFGDNSNDITSVKFDSSFKDYNKFSSTGSWFYRMTNLKSISNLEYLNTQNVTDMSQMFMLCNSLTTLDLRSLNTSNVNYMSRMFEGCSNLTSLDVSNFNTSKVTDMIFMFSKCENLTSLDVSKFNTQNVTNMYGMFQSCEKLTSLDLSSFNTSNVTNMVSMFALCNNLTTIKFGNFNTSKVTDMKTMFSGCYNLTSLDVSKFNTQNVTDMSYMFLGCGKLTSLNLSNFNTSQVTDMSSMFYECLKLESLDFSNFNTSKVEDMKSMFYRCENLKSLDLSTFNTSKVKDMKNMFYYCINLTSLDISNFNTSQVKNMNHMFYDCRNLMSLDLSNFNTQNVTDMSVMFYGCDKLTSLDVSKFDTKNVTDMGSMFYGCHNLTSLDVSKFDTQNVTNMASMFRGCNSLTSLDVSKFDTQNVTDMNNMFGGCSNLTSLGVSKFNTSNVTNMKYMFGGCNHLTSLDVNKFDTQSVTDMSSMFINCEQLTTLDISKFKTSKVSDMSDMFTGCQNLTSLDVSNFNMQNVTDMSDMFWGCRNLTYIYCSKETNWSSVTESSRMFFGCYNLRGYCDSRTTFYSDINTDASFARICTSTQDGYFTLKGTKAKMAKVLWDSTQKTLVFFYDEKSYSEGSTFVSDGTTYTVEWVKEWKPITDYLSWGSSVGFSIDVTTAIFDKSFSNFYPISCEWLFSGSDKLCNIVNLRNLNTSKVTNMRGMFSGCQSLTSLDVSKFDTQNVTNMSSMFYNCQNLTSLDLSNFKVSNVTKMSYMFSGCSNLVTIYCAEGTDWSRVAESTSMFSWCQKLKGNAEGRTTLYSANNVDASFARACTAKQDGYFTIVGTIINTAKVLWDSTQKTLVFFYDDNTYNEGSTFVSDGTTYTAEWVKEWEPISDYRSWGTITDATTSVFDNSFKDFKPISCYQLFSGYENLTNLVNLNNLNTSQVNNMSYMFYNCKNLTTLDVSDFDISKVTKMNCMFYSCNNLTSIYCAEGTDWSGVAESSYMFYGCSNLRGKCNDRTTYYSYDKTDASLARACTAKQDGYFTIVGTIINTAKVLWDGTKKTLVFFYDDNTYSNGSAFVSDGITYTAEWVKEWKPISDYRSWGIVTDATSAVFDDSFKDFRPVSCNELFSSYTNLEKIINLKNLNTSKVTSMYSMFANCQNLTSLDVSNFNTENVTSMRGMFNNCQNLTSLDVSNFNTGNVSNIRGMFYNCKKISSLDVSKFNTSKVTDMSNMFYYCQNLTSLDVSKFDTQNVTNMSAMFFNCQNLPLLDISKFNTAQVTDMSSMFRGCSKLTSLDVSSFDVSKVTKMNYMLYGCSNLISIYCAEGTDWSGVAESTNMFYGCSNLRGQCSDRITYYSSGVSDATLAHICTPTQDGYFTLVGTEVKVAKVLWDSTKKTLVFFYDDNMYNEGSTFVSDGTTYTAEWVKEWKLDNEYPSWRKWVKDANDVTTAVFDDSFREFKPINCAQLFSSYLNIKKIINLNNLNTSKVINMDNMFYGCQKLSSLDVSYINTENVTSMRDMFNNCLSLKSIDVSKFNTSQVTDMSNMFYYCQNLTSLDVSNFDTRNVTDMSGMFVNCYNLTSLDVSKFDTQNVNNMGSMFFGCYKLASLDVTKFNTQSVTNMSLMFYCCDNLTSLDVSKFNIDKVTDMSSMFLNCNNLATIYCAEGTDWSGVAESTNMFGGCGKLKGYAEGRTTNYSYDKTDATLARICTKDQDGYFTDKNMTITGIQSVEDIDLNNSEIYNVQGVRIPTLHKGLNIIKMSDGTTKKVMVK